MTTEQRIKPATIRKTVRVRANRARAFEIFAARMGSWWMKDHSVLKMRQQTSQSDVIVEPLAGARWFETGENGAEYQWGQVVTWDPPARLTLTWQLNGEWEYDPDFETIIDVTFVEDGDHTEVRFEHRGLEAYGAGAVERFENMDGGWGALLERFAAAAEV